MEEAALVLASPPATSRTPTPSPAATASRASNRQATRASRADTASRVATATRAATSSRSSSRSLPSRLSRPRPPATPHHPAPMDSRPRPAHTDSRAAAMGSRALTTHPVSMVSPRSHLCCVICFDLGSYSTRPDTVTDGQLVGRNLSKLSPVWCSMYVWIAKETWYQSRNSSVIVGIYKIDPGDAKELRSLSYLYNCRS